jgi:hypothetical protein
MVHDETWDSLAANGIANVNRVLSASPWTMNARQPHVRDAEIRKHLARIDAAADAALGLYRRADKERRAELNAIPSERLADLLNFEPTRERCHHRAR